MPVLVGGARTHENIKFDQLIELKSWKKELTKEKNSVNKYVNREGI